MLSLLFRVIFAFVSLSLRLSVMVGTLLGQLLGLGAVKGWQAWQRARAARAAQRQSIKAAAAAAPAIIAPPTNSDPGRLPRVAPERRYPTTPRPLRTERQRPNPR